MKKTFLKLFKIISALSFICIFLIPDFAHAEANPEPLSFLLKREISKSYSGARIVLKDIQWIRGQAPQNPSEVTIMGDDARGNIHFSATEAETPNSQANAPAHPANLANFEGWVGFSAWVPAKIALHRIRPSQILTPELFTDQEINIASGQPREFRGLIYSAEGPVQGVESIQTILEGQYLVSSAIHRIPDVRRGDSVRIRIMSGGLVLQTMGIAEEPSYVNQQVRVVAGKAKRELSGNLKEDRVVEVNL